MAFLIIPATYLNTLKHPESFGPEEAQLLLVLFESCAPPIWSSGKAGCPLKANASFCATIVDLNVIGPSVPKTSQRTDVDNRPQNFSAFLQNIFPPVWSQQALRSSSASPSRIDERTETVRDFCSAYTPLAQTTRVVRGPPSSHNPCGRKALVSHPLRWTVTFSRSPILDGYQRARSTLLPS
jgi:hypothetical protein